MIGEIALSIIIKFFYTEHPAETHIDSEGNLTPEYYAWRQKGFACKDPVRFPVGMSFKARSSCQYSLATKKDGTIDPNKKLDCVAARKKIYVKEYCSNVKRHSQFKILKELLESGNNIIIIEVDGHIKNH